MRRIACVHMFLGNAWVHAGLVEIKEDGRFSLCRFRYFDEYLERGNAVAVDPVSLPLHDAAQRVFDGPRGGDLFGGIEDACPDSWGMHVLDIAAENVGRALRPFDYMLYAGHDRIGALGFSEKLTHPPFSHIPDWALGRPGAELNLEEMLKAADKVDSAENLEPRLRRFFVRGSSLGGAKPKAAIEHEGKSWIAKFGAVREALPTCRLEHAAMTLAGVCGIRTPQTRIVTVFDNRDILLVERFDRRDGSRIPFVSALTLLGRSRSGADSPATYADIAAAMRRYGLAGDLKKNLAELFSRMVFNICCHNNDDHLRNHGFLHNGTGRNGWTLSPAYDVVPQPRDHGAAHLHLGVGTHGRAATFENALTSCAHFGLTREEASSIIRATRDIVSANWEKALRDAGVATSLVPRARESFGAVLESVMPFQNSKFC